MKTRLLRVLVIAPIAVVVIPVLMVVDANLQHLLGQYWLPIATIGVSWLRLLTFRSADYHAKSAAQSARKHWQCAGCGYDFRSDRREIHFCPRCGKSQSTDAHIHRRRELMLELERLQNELVRNHRDRPT